MFLIYGDVNLFSFFNEVEVNKKAEIFNYINFLKSKPNKAEFINYKISQESFKIFTDVIEELIKKPL